jgi:pimeloyl-ACP methyl ester carboxylesterase
MLTHIGNLPILGYVAAHTALQAVCHLRRLKGRRAFLRAIFPTKRLAKLKTPVLFISGTQDKWINPDESASLN